MSGYVAITSPEWFKYNRLLNNKRVIFWRKHKSPVNLDRGTWFFLLLKGKRPRNLVGYARVEEIGSEKLAILWKQYGRMNGADSLEDMEFRLGLRKDRVIGYYVLEEVKYLSGHRFLSDDEIEFDRHIVSGKRIGGSELEKLLVKMRKRFE